MLYNVKLHIIPCPMEQNLITEIEQYAGRANLAPSTVCERAGQGGRFYSRLLQGGRCWPETAEKIRKFMADHPVDSVGVHD